MVFIRPIAFDPKKGFGTGEMTLPFNILEKSKGEKEELVEAGGIEPPSERFQSKVSTCLSSVLNLAWTLSQRQDGD